ncbi:SP_0009 family protein [Streptococcus fryi]
MDDLIKVIQTFLNYSDEKLEELSEKNKALKLLSKHDIKHIDERRR